MPTYDVRDTETGKDKEIICSYSTLQEMITNGKVTQVHKGSSAKIVSEPGTALGKTSGDWKDLLKVIKKGSGRGNTVNI
jgi:hypothetical protein